MVRCWALVVGVKGMVNCWWAGPAGEVGVVKSCWWVWFAGERGDMVKCWVGERGLEYLRADNARRDCNPLELEKDVFIWRGE